jgi:hypothetical protein
MQRHVSSGLYFFGSIRPIKTDSTFFLYKTQRKMPLLRMSSDESLRMTGQEGWSFLAGSGNTLEMTSWMGCCGQLGRNLALGTGSLEIRKNNFLKNDFR